MKTLKTAVLGSLFLGAALGLSAAADQAIAEKNSRGAQWIGTWATAAQPFLPGALETYQNQSLRLIVHTSAGGARVRIKISNTYGDEPLIVGGAHIGRRRSGADIEPTSDRRLTFGGQSSIAVAAHSVAQSDPVNLDVPALSDLAISLFFPRATKATTSHALALQTSYVSSATGDSTAEAKFVVALRDPRDVCLSCFMQPLPLNQVSAMFLSLETTVAEYGSVMGLWRAMAPRLRNPHLEIRYEDVVDNLELCSRRVLDFLDIPWDPCVLRFNEHAREKLVRSPTYLDVMKPVFKGAVGRWRNYQKHLEPCLEALAPFVKAFGYA